MATQVAVQGGLAKQSEGANWRRHRGLLCAGSVYSRAGVWIAASAQLLPGLRTLVAPPATYGSGCRFPPTTHFFSGPQPWLKQALPRRYWHIRRESSD